MHVVVDAVAVRPGSAAVVVENLLRGWRQAAPEDRLTVLVDPRAPLDLPEGVRAHTPRVPALPAPLRGLWLRSVGVRRAARRLRADAVLSGVPASGLLGARCVRGLLLYDLRHELRPRQFSRAQRLARRLSWGWSMARADGVYTISGRTLDDLARLHPRLARRGVAALLGADHVDRWPRVDRPDAPYALAFGHFANKNAAAVLDGWAHACRTGAVDGSWTLRLVGMAAADRAAAAERVAALGLERRVELMPWLDDAAFQECFAAAALVVFPSDFEGFGLPAVEAMRLGVPVVVSADRALAEVTGGHATVAESVRAADLAGAVAAATRTTAAQLEAARRHTDALTWRRTARTIRDSLASGGQRRSGSR